VTNEDLAQATAAVVRVGDARGFIIEHAGKRLVVTAAHCLPRVPEPHPARYIWENTFEKLLGSLDIRRSTLRWKRCLQPTAVLGLPIQSPGHTQRIASIPSLHSSPQ
jgi:hypothetical protein